MKIELEINEYNPDHGLTNTFTGGGVIKITQLGEDGFSIRGDRVGFEDLATALLTLAHNEGIAPSFSHIHVDQHPMLAKGSSSVVVQYLLEE